MLNQVTLGKAIREIRKEKRYELRYAAERAGMKKTRLADVEAGRYQSNFFTIYRIAKALNVSLEELTEKADSEEIK